MFAAAPVVATGFSAARAPDGAASTQASATPAGRTRLPRIADPSPSGWTVHRVNTRLGPRVAPELRCCARMSVGATFHALVGDLEYPMFIVTARAGAEPLGCLVGFATQTSIDPPRFAVCLSHRNRTYRRGRDARALGDRKSVV